MIVRFAAGHNERPSRMNFSFRKGVVLATISIILGAAVGINEPVSGQSLPLAPVQTSWGVGVVVPQGSRLQTGGLLNWVAVNNATVVISVPHISDPNSTVYAILSLMTAGGTVFQVALGAYPGDQGWLAYAMYVEGINNTPQVYHWSLNSSGPPYLPGDRVALSINVAHNGSWAYGINDLGDGGRVSGYFGANDRSSPVGSDQETITLESYTSDPASFASMGNMTAESVMLNGVKAVGPWFTYGSWDPTHYLPFVVGGANPPVFIGISVLGGSAVWAFTGNPIEMWNYDGGAPAAFSYVALVAGAFVLAVFLLRRSGGRPAPWGAAGGTTRESE